MARTSFSEKGPPTRHIDRIHAIHPAAASLGAREVGELITYAKARARELNYYASGGIGNSGNLAAALFGSMAGVQLTHIPYKGTGLAMPDLLGGRVQMLFNSMLQGMPYVRRRQLNALAVTTAQRSAIMPEQFSVFLVAEMDKWAALVKSSGMKID